MEHGNPRAMNKAQYQARRAAMQAPTYRDLCPQCRKATKTCYCHAIKPFQAPFTFVILQHPDESKNAIATARMAHLSMTNSKLFVGRSFAEHNEINDLIASPAHRNFMLFPSANAVALEDLFADLPLPSSPFGTGESQKPLVFWVLDAKWSQVPKMLRLSPNIRKIPMVKFEPDRLSQFQIRRQPRPAYLSTIESIYLVIERFRRNQPKANTEHQALLDVFQYLVHQQLSFVNADDKRHYTARMHRAARRQKERAE